MRFQIGDYVTPVSDRRSNLNGGIDGFLGHVGIIVGWNSAYKKWQVNFENDMEGLEDCLHTCSGALPKRTGQNIAECDLEFVGYEDQHGDGEDKASFSDEGIDDLI